MYSSGYVVGTAPNDAVLLMTEMQPGAESRLSYTDVALVHLWEKSFIQMTQLLSRITTSWSDNDINPKQALQ